MIYFTCWLQNKILQEVFDILHTTASHLMETYHRVVHRPKPRRAFLKATTETALLLQRGQDSIHLNRTYSALDLQHNLFEEDGTLRAKLLHFF